tara:strand:+ start:885 stop:1424 length:540 start_codon:yes stop_codon:yes gene_type:complete
MDYQQIIKFWFTDITPAQWWEKDTDFDQMLSNRFGEIHQQVVQCELCHWRESALGRLAEIIVIDQFSRNIYRDNPMAFLHDPLAVALAQEAIAIGADYDLSESQRNFMYMPFMHSESLIVHHQAQALFADKASDSTYQFELKHLAIIERFGRYPHRNSILQRKSTNEELAFLEQSGSSF